MLLLGGVPCLVGPPDCLSAAERRALARLPAAPTHELIDAQIFQLELVDGPPWSDELLFQDPGPARAAWHHDSVRVRQAGFLAELSPFSAQGRLYRTAANAYALEATLRIAMSCRLPLEGGLPLHAAGLLDNEQAFVFFGPSGAGKSTAAASWPGPILSDELVAVTKGTGGRREFKVAATGFWGELGQSRADSGFWSLRALVALEKGPSLRLELLSPETALRRLIEVTLVPESPPLWSRALAVIGELAREVPCYRMAWSPAEPPWEALKERLSI
jgi:hypothetical protein